jgi:phenylacetate-CoA ligase
MDALTVAVETRAGTAPDSEAARRAAQLLQHEIKSFIGTSARVELRAEGGVERSAGKARRVLDQRNSKR